MNFVVASEKARVSRGALHARTGKLSAHEAQ